MRPQHVWCLLITFLLPFIHINAQPADLILTNGKIFTSDSKQLYAQAIAIKGNKILAVGTNAAINKLISKQTKQIDLKGKTVVPGFNDAHDHLGFYAPVGLSYNYSEMNPDGLSKEAVLDSISRLVKFAQPNQWIQGFIGVKILFDSTMRNALDSIAPKNPILLQAWWGHGQVVNARALEGAGLSDSSDNPLGGWYEKTENKIVAVHENAQLPIWTAWSISEKESLIKGMHGYSQEQLKGGITTVQQMSGTLNGAESIMIFKQADLPQRIRIVAWPHSNSKGRKLWEWDLKKNSELPSRIYLSGIKYTIDGSPMERNALRSVPYPDKEEWYGRFNYPIDTMKQIFKEALTTDRQLMMHITADSSFGVVLSLMKGMASGEQWRAKRVRIEHNCVGEVKSGNISMANRKILKDLGIIMMHTS